MPGDRPAAVLFDIGGPIDTEVISEALADRDLRLAFQAEGVPVTAKAIGEASAHAVATFAPDAYRAMAWRLAGGDAGLALRAYQRFAEGSPARANERGGLELRPGMSGLIADLAAAGVPLAFAANQPPSVRAELERAGVLTHFRGRLDSAQQRYRKPDPRLFLAACASIATEPRACVMVGDRIDNDIVPARLLGMATIRMRTGRHAEQAPRSWEELPDRDVVDAEGLRAVLTEWSLLPAGCHR